MNAYRIWQARKKMRTEKNMEKLKKKAGTITNNPDLTEKAKQRALEKVLVFFP